MLQVSGTSYLGRDVDHGGNHRYRHTRLDALGVVDAVLRLTTSASLARWGDLAAGRSVSVISAEEDKRRALHGSGVGAHPDSPVH
jgi:hypothetical protein